MADLVTAIARAQALTQLPDNYYSSDTLEQAAREALARLSCDRPRQLTVTFLGDGSTRVFPLVPPFDSMFSLVLEVEYPGGMSPRALLPPDAYRVVTDAAPPELVLEHVTPSAGEVVRVVYTSRHTLAGLDGATETTLTDSVFDALTLLLGAQLLMRAASRFLQDTEPVLADAVAGRQSRAMDAQRLAQELEARYRELVSVGGAAGARGTVVVWDVPGEIVLSRFGRRR
ncbi:MAG: hypothetical protein RMJ05_07990 [Thermomicrobium sp.]|nr:hypothetical protein [Thermomicrobium sp.]MDW8006648.1 hypothetical protein [Thermomicrobium sp.]